MEWVYLILAITLELVATTLLKYSDGFSKILPSLGSSVCYILCFWFLSISLKKIDVSVAYAIWSAAGIVVLSVIGVLVFKENMNLLKAVSIAFIVLGVIGLNLGGISH